MHPLRSSSKHSIVSLLVRRSRFFRFTSFSKKGTFFRTPWLQRLGLLVFPEDKPHFTTASCFSVAHSAWSFLHTSFLLLPSKKKCQGESPNREGLVRQYGEKCQGWECFGFFCHQLVPLSRKRKRATLPGQLNLPSHNLGEERLGPVNVPCPTTPERSAIGTLKGSSRIAAHSPLTV